MPNRGIRYPFSLRAGFPQEAKDEVLVASALTQLFSQERGERVYGDTNGVSILPYTFESEEALVAADVRREIILAVSKHEPRVSIESVPVRYKTEEGQRLLDLLMLWRFRGLLFSVSRTVLAGLDQG